MNIGTISLLWGLASFFRNYRDAEFAITMDKATKRANEMGIEAIFWEKCIIRKKKQFDEIGSDEVK